MFIGPDTPRKKGNQGYANIYEADEAVDVVPCVAYSVLKEGLSTLDQYEGVKSGCCGHEGAHYARQKVSIYFADGSKAIATAYVACPDATFNGGLLPRKDYVEHLVAGKDLLPASYVDDLVAGPTWA